MIKKLISLFLICFSFGSFAQKSSKVLDDDQLFLDFEKKHIDRKKIEGDKDKYLRDETIISEVNDETGIITEHHYTATDKNRITGAYQFHYEPNKIAEASAFEIEYARKFSTFWVQAFVGQMTTKFEYITENPNTSTSNSNAESNNRRVNGQDEDLTQFGLGISYRFKLNLDFFKTKNIFNDVKVYGTYNTLTESFRSLDYTGYGLRATYALHHRFTKRLQYGFQLNYNLATVAREALTENESRSERSLTLTWLTLGVSVGLFF